MVLLRRPSQRTSIENTKLEKLEKIAVAARANDENRAVSIVGIGLIFIGFVFQTVGAVLMLADVISSGN